VLPSTAPAARTGTLPRGPPRREPDTEPTTRIPWSAAPSESWPDRRWCGLRSSGLPPAGVSPHGTHPPAPPPYSSGSAGDGSGMQPQQARNHGTPPARSMPYKRVVCPFNYARMYNVTRIVLDSQIGDDEIRQAVFKMMSRTDLEASVQQIENIVRPPEDVYYRELRGSYRRVLAFCRRCCAP
jgi:hypothetical protein